MYSGAQDLAEDIVPGWGADQEITQVGQTLCSKQAQGLPYQSYAARL